MGRIRFRLAVVLAVIAAAASAALAGPAAVGASSVTFDGSPGTSAPPSTLGPYTMSTFSTSSASNGTSVTSVNQLDTFGGAQITFDHPLKKQTVPAGWSTWSHGYTGDVYTNIGGAPAQDALTIGLPTGTSAFYFYAEPNNFAVFNVTATAQDGTTSGATQVNGTGGAKYFGFYGDPGNPLVSISVSVDSGAAGFAVGEFGISVEGFSSDVSLTKVVAGDAAAAGPTSVQVSCTYGAPITVDFPAEGGTHVLTLQSSATLMNVCTFTETDNAGATSTTYACAGTNPPDTQPTAAALDDQPCPVTGPQAAPISVNIAAPDQTAAVTITNTYTAAAPLVLQPHFTG
jgi:hypothetical protein